MASFKEVFLLFFIFHTMIMASGSGTVKLFGMYFALRFYVLVVLMRDSNWVSPKLPRGFYE
jgi:predicted Kef-type K+ transport protein